MAILTAVGLGKYYGAQDIFHALDLQVEPGDRIGLVGPNGEGKTTLLRILAGLEESTAGRLDMRRGLTISYLPQHAELGGDETLFQAMLEVFRELHQQEIVLRELECRMAGSACAPEVFERYGDLQNRFELAGGYTYEAHIRQVLGGLGFSEVEFTKPLAIMSGGQRTRARLAKVLLEAPDLLLLDEPTNHLDLAGIEWLESYLSTWKGNLIVVAHDRRFLDKVTTRIWDMAFGRLESYQGNYSRYVALREERMARRQAEYDAQQAMLAREQLFIQRYGAGQRSKEARGRLRRLERVEVLERPREHKEIHLHLQTDLRSGDLVLRTYELRVGYPGLELLQCPDLLLRRGEHVAVLGPNGSGKTTLVRTVLGELPPLAGQVHLGANVRIGYLAQAHAGLRLEKTVLDEILDTRNLPLEKARNFLGRFLFSGEDIYKRIGDLSGGERSRVALAQLTLQGANFLILDEPTNHLDIRSQEILEHVLGQFRGTILLISHDRQFVDALATQVWLVEGRRLVTFSGTYSEYLAAQENERNATEENGVHRANAQRQEEEDRRERLREGRRQEREERLRRERVTALERQAAELEEELRRLTQQLEKASAAQNTAEVLRLGQRYQARQQELERVLNEWAELA